MFDIGMPELFIIAALALIVVGPKDLPQAIRTITAWIRKARMMTRDFQAGVNDMVREAELDDVKKQITSPGDLKKSLTDAVDPDGEVSRSLDLSEADNEKIGAVSLDGTTSEDDEGMMVPDDDETGPDVSVEPVEVLDEDVMPIAAPAEDKPETKA